MTGETRSRAVLALAGGLAGVSLYLLVELMDQRLLDDRVALALTVFVASFFNGLLAMTGPLPLRRAAPGALAVAVLVTVAMAWASLRFVSVGQMVQSSTPVLAGAVLALVPLPFLIAADGPGWRDYPTLFTQAWTIVVRFAGAWLFVGVVWGVVFLSDTLLSIVGLTLIRDLVELGVMPWAISGVTFGLALAVVTEMSDLVSPYLVLRLLRLLLPVVLAVMALFIVALPVRGLSGLFGTLSAATILLTMVAVAATLVTTAIDQTDAEASANPVLRRSAQGLALLMAVPAALGAWAVWLRVADYGWTPDRVLAATVAAIAMGYGATYAAAVLRGAGWMERIRQGNTRMALVLLTAAATLLTLLNPEAISARSQLARIQDGRTAPQAMDPEVFYRWGRPGAEARATIEALAKQPGQEALAQRLAELQTDRPSEALLADLRVALPVQPASATDLRDRILAEGAPDQLRGWLAACRTPLPDGSPGCVLAVADLWPLQPGDEAILVTRDPSGLVTVTGFALRDGRLDRLPVALRGGDAGARFGSALPVEDWLAVIAALQKGQPAVEPAPINVLNAAGRALLVMP